MIWSGLQPTLAALSRARTEVCVQLLVMTLMNVTAHGPGITGKTARLVSQNRLVLKKQNKQDVIQMYHITVLKCVSAELLTWLKVSLKPTPNTVHYILTHFKAFWNILNNIPFLRDSVMSYVLTCK